jgi:hypothetical protein
MRRLAAPLVLAAAVSACIGDIGDGDTVVTAPPPAPACVASDGPRPGASPIRRMTRFEYDATVRDLLGDTTSPAAGFGAEEEALGFNNNAANLVTSSALAEKYMVAAEGISERATEPLSRVVSCDARTIGVDACAREFIRDFGRRAFRRPLTSDEETMFFDLFTVGRIDSGFRSGIQLVIQAALQSPAFLYRVEIGIAAAAGEEVVRLDAWEMASRLSYLLWGSMPDEELFDAAESGALDTREAIAAQARRMLQDPKARAAVNNFHQQWLDYERIAGVGKSAQFYPEYTPDIGELMRTEAEAFVEHAVFDEGGDLATLLTAPRSFMNDDLAAFYGVEGPGTESFAEVALDPGQRAGVLTLGALLTINAHSNQTSPVHRGKLVREQLFCQTMAPPPPEVMITVPEPGAGTTARERFAQHSEDPGCSGCHTLMDPIGFGFERYDGVGRFRSTDENGAAIDASGSLTATDVDGAFVGAVELARMLAESEVVEDCYVTQWFRYAYGRGESTDDACTLGGLQAELRAHDGSIQELLVALTQTDAFLYRRTGGAQ